MFKTPFRSFKLERIPKTNKGDLRAWDAADELLLQAIFDQFTSDQNSVPAKQPKHLLIINDAFGALALALNDFKPHCWSDSYLSHLATEDNLQLNHLHSSPKSNDSNDKYIPSSTDLLETYDYVLIKIPKTLSLLEDQLCRLKPHIKKDTIVIAASMTKHIHTSTINLFEKIIGSTTTSRAVKKARLIFSQNDKNGNTHSPYPKIIHDESLEFDLSNHANVFSQDHLDIGTRFFLEHLKQCPNAQHIIDLGCGNGVLGGVIQKNQPQAHIHFVDESYMAIVSARVNYQKINSNKEASFYTSNCLAQYTGEEPDLILCNPPFHQAHSVGDEIAWQMFKQSHDKLKSGGELWIVGNRHLAYHTKLKRLFGNCKSIAANKKFVVLSARKPIRKHS